MTDDRACSFCGKPLLPRNTRGFCYLCSHKGKTLRRCKCGCGAFVTKWSRTGYSLLCWRRLIKLRPIPVV